MPIVYLIENISREPLMKAERLQVVGIANQKRKGFRLPMLRVNPGRSVVIPEFIFRAYWEHLRDEVARKAIQVSQVVDGKNLGPVDFEALGLPTRAESRAVLKPQVPDDKILAPANSAPPQSEKANEANAQAVIETIKEPSVEKVLPKAPDPDPAKELIPAGKTEDGPKPDLPQIQQATEPEKTPETPLTREDLMVRTAKQLREMLDAKGIAHKASEGKLDLVKKLLGQEI